MLFPSPHSRGNGFFCTDFVQSRLLGAGTDKTHTTLSGKDQRMNNRVKNDEIEIDLLRLVGLLWSKAWLIVISMLLFGAIMFSYAMFFITPLYQSTAKMYVNNTSIKVGSTSFSISSSELSAAKTLLDLYVEILKTRTTLEEVIRRAELEYTYEQLSSMITAGAVNGTEIFRITVTDSDPDMAEKIADTIVEVLPDRIAEIVDGSSVRLVDHAVRAVRRSSPDYTRYASIGMAAGMILSCAAIIVLDLMDTSVRGEEYLAQRYSDIQVLAVVPDIRSARKRPYGYYYKNKEYRNPGRGAADGKGRT